MIIKQQRGSNFLPAIIRVAVSAEGRTLSLENTESAAFVSRNSRIAGKYRASEKQAGNIESLSSLTTAAGGTDKGGRRR